MKRVAAFCIVVMLVWVHAFAENTEYTGACPHSLCIMDRMAKEHVIILKDVQNVSGYSSAQCKYCGEIFLLYPEDAPRTLVHPPRDLCLHHFRKSSQMIEKGWYPFDENEHTWIEYYLAFCDGCGQLLKYYKMPENYKEHVWTDANIIEYHHNEYDMHIIIGSCTTCGMVSATEEPCTMYENGFCTYKLREALEFYGG